MTDPDDETVKVALELLSDTDEAWEVTDGDVVVWLPKSLAEPDGRGAAAGEDEAMNMREHLVRVACINTCKVRIEGLGLPSDWCAAPHCKCYERLGLPVIAAILAELPEAMVVEIDALEPKP